MIICFDIYLKFQNDEYMYFAHILKAEFFILALNDYMLING